MFIRGNLCKPEMSVEKQAIQGKGRFLFNLDFKAQGKCNLPSFDDGSTEEGTMAKQEQNRVIHTTAYSQAAVPCSTHKHL